MINVVSSDIIHSFSLCIQLALSAASPIWRGYLTEIECRWNVLCAMVDDRTKEERGLEVTIFTRRILIDRLHFCSP